MFDIISCEASPQKHGFERFYHSKDAKILRADNLSSAVNFKNKSSLILLQDYAFDEGAIKVIAEKKKLCFLIDLSQIIKSYGVRRAILMSKLRTFLSLCNRHGAFYAFCSFSKDEKSIRSPEEMLSIASLLGVNRGQAKFALKMLPHYL